MFKNIDLESGIKYYLDFIRDNNDFYKSILDGIQPSAALKNRTKTLSSDDSGNRIMEYQDSISDYKFSDSDVRFIPNEHYLKIISLLKDLPLYPPNPRGNEKGQNYQERINCYFFPGIMSEYIEMTVKTDNKNYEFEDFGFLVPFGTLFNAALEVLDLSPVQLSEKYQIIEEDIIFHLSAIYQAFSLINDGTLDPRDIINLMSDTKWHEPAHYYGLNPGHFQRITQAGLQSPHYTPDRFCINSIGIILIRTLFALGSFEIKQFKQCALCYKYFVPNRKNNIYCQLSNPEYPECSCSEASAKIRAKDAKKKETSDKLHKRIKNRLEVRSGIEVDAMILQFANEYNNTKSSLSEDLRKYEKLLFWLNDADNRFR